MLMPKAISSSLLLFLAANPAILRAETNNEISEAQPASKGDVSTIGIVSDTSPTEIVVTAGRRGEAKVASESEFSEEEIASHGSDSIQDLLIRLSPFIDASGEEPIILINGKPIGFDRSILSFPAEALDRLAVLKPEAAAQYGEPSGKRVVNLVLKKSFASLSVDAGIRFATAGGQHGEDLSVERSAINGETRWNVQARLSRDSEFLKSSRNIPKPDGIFDRLGFISAPDGGEIDPRLSGVAGIPVTAAAIPPGALTGIPTATDFAGTANILHPIDPNRFSTLQAERRNATLAIGITRPIGEFAASLSLNANRNESEDKRGLPMASLVIPSGHPWSPFTEDIILTRPFAGDRALSNQNASTSLSASLTINGAIAGWQTNMSLNYGRNWTDGLFEAGIDTVSLQNLIDSDDPFFNPYGVWDDEFLLATRTRASGENLNARINVRKAILELPAGPIVWNILAGISRNKAQNWRAINASENLDSAETLRSQADGQMSINLPLTRQGQAGLGAIGDLSIDLTTSAQTMTNSRLRSRYSGGINWAPSPNIQLRGSIDFAKSSPSFEQLDAPIITSINRIFDYATQEIAEPIWITGGNTELRGGSQQNMSFAATLRPLGSQVLTVNVSYRQSVLKGGIASFPELTPALEAAFPGRVLRDPDGHLISVDARPINIARDNDASMSSSIALRFGQNKRRLPGTDPLQFNLSLSHRWRLKNELLTHPGLSVIDQFKANGQSRHNLSLQISAGKRAAGGSLNGSWSSPSQVSNPGKTFHYKPPLIFSLSMFIEPDRLFFKARPKGFLSGMKVSFGVQNILNGYRRVTLSDGSVPAGYTRDEIDPLGRTMRINIRKRF